MSLKTFSWLVLQSTSEWYQDLHFPECKRLKLTFVAVCKAPKYWTIQTRYGTPLFHTPTPFSLTPLPLPPSSPCRQIVCLRRHDLCSKLRRNWIKLSLHKHLRAVSCECTRDKLDHFSLRPTTIDGNNAPIFKIAIFIVTNLTYYMLTPYIYEHLYIFIRFFCNLILKPEKYINGIN